MKKKITTRFIMKHRPCDGYPEHIVRQLIGRGKTPLEILDLDIPAADRIWVMTRPGVTSKKECVEFAIACAKRTLRNFERKYPDDKRPRNAITAAVTWLKNPTEQNRKRAAWSAESAAWSAVSAESAEWSAESAAWSAESAAWSAVSAESAAWSAESAESAARSAESAEWSAEWSAASAARDQQIKDLRRIIKRRTA